MKRICRSLISKDSFIIIHFLAAFIMSEDSSKSRYSPSCHLTAPPAGQHTLGRQSHTAPPSCPTRRNLQGATPGKCVSLKFRCCSISLSPAATSGRHKPLLRTDKQFKDLSAQQSVSRSFIARNGFLPPLPGNHKDLRIKAKIKSDVCVSY